MDTTASQGGFLSLIPPKGDDTVESTLESLCQQTPIHGDAITPEMESIPPPLPSAPALQTGEVQDPGPMYIGPIVNPQTESSPQTVSHPPSGIQAMAGNYNPQEHPPPSYDSLVPVQPFQQPLPTQYHLQYPPYQQQQPTYPTINYQPNQPQVHHPQLQHTGVAFVAVSYQGTVIQQPRPLPPIKTSFKFGTIGDDNQFYIAICLLVCVIVCINLLALTCAISGLYFAYKSARANQQNMYEEARKHHRTASNFNIGTAVTIFAFGVLGISFCIVVIPIIVAVS